MNASIPPEQVFPSTTWRWKHVKIKPPARAQSTSEVEDEPASRLGLRDRRRALWIEVRFLGGSECWWLIRARGRQWRIPGDRCVEDLMHRINCE